MPREVFTDAVALSSVCLFIFLSVDLSISFFVGALIFVTFSSMRSVLTNTNRSFVVFSPEDDGDMKQKQILSCAVLIGRTSSVNIIRDPCVYLQFLG